MVSSSLFRLGVLGLIPILAVGCPPSDEGTEKAPQAPVIVVQAPPDNTGATPTGVPTVGGPAATGGSEPYAGLAWQSAGLDTKAGEPGAEPFDVISLLREFDPQLIDPPDDQKGKDGWTDLLSALAVMDARYLYARVVPRVPMKRDSFSELRFWLEQDGKMVTVEVKVGTRGNPCELSALEAPDKQELVEECFWSGNAIDLRIPIGKIPGGIDVKQPYWVSGFQSCCIDEARNDPYDQVADAQEVWRVPGLAAELERTDAEGYVPGGEQPDGAPNVP